MKKYSREKPGELNTPGSCKDIGEMPKARGSWLLGQPVTQTCFWRALKKDL